MKALKSIISLIIYQNLNPIKTIYINFKMFPWRIAIKRPIFIYNNFELTNLKGKILIDSPIQMGMIKIGQNSAGYVTAGKGSIRLLPNSVLHLQGQILIAQGSHICIRPDAKLSIGHGSLIGDNAKIICYKKIHIGNKTWVAWETQLTDFNSHYIINLKNEEIPNITKSVHIGNNCWIGNRTTIMPGTILPDYTIIASNSLLNKNYINAGIKPYSLIGGQPAKLIKENVKRIYDKDLENHLHLYFKENEINHVNAQTINISKQR